MVVVKNTHGLLAEIVSRTQCKPGWRFLLDREEGLRLVIVVPGPNSWEPDQEFRVRHYFPVPLTTWNEKTWRRWIFECCRGVENHELGEWFQVGAERPFLPLHGPGEDPYTIHEFRDEVDARMTQDGSIRENGPRP